jgi:hypothetical protein
MKKDVRDTMGVALKKLGFSVNSTMTLSFSGKTAPAGSKASCQRLLR